MARQGCRATAFQDTRERHARKRARASRGAGGSPEGLLGGSPRRPFALEQRALDVNAPGETADSMFLDFSGRQPIPVEGASMEPGTYMLMCFVGGKTPHALLGMVKKITVS